MIQMGAPEMPVCEFCRTEVFMEDMGMCPMEVACDDCMERFSPCNYCRHRAACDGFYELATEAGC